MPKKQCSINGCERVYEASNYCAAHYQRYRKGRLNASDPIILRHGLTKTPEYSSWYAMKYRCSNPNDSRYRDYGGRGICVCGGFKIFLYFYDIMGEKPSPEYSIDRIDVNGNYSCGECVECMSQGWKLNCRWATPSQQSRNKRPLHNQTGFKGVLKYHNKYKAQANINGIQHYLGLYNTAEEAYNACVKAGQE